MREEAITNHMNNLLKSAKAYVKKGISVVATDDNKRATVSWKRFQQALPEPQELEQQFASPRAKGIAIITGAVSGSLEVIDVDCKYDTTGTLMQDLMQAITDAMPSLAQRLMVIQTKSKGYHLYYRCPVIAGNQKLAQRPATAEEVAANPNEKVLVLIETRGEGGYVVAPPTEGYVKTSGEWIPDITEDEREALLEIARSFNQYVVEHQRPQSARHSTDTYAVTPWEDYNRRGVNDMIDRLQAAGWTLVGQKGSKTIFKRPGRTESKSSGDYCHDLNLFTVFTTSSQFEPLKGYRPAAVYAMLQCNGDFKEAARQLSDLGYGEKPQAFDTKMEKDLFNKRMDGYKPEELQKVLTGAQYGKSPTEAAEIVTALEKQWGEKLCVFWDVDRRSGRVTINRTRFSSFLHEVGGFGLYFYDASSTIYRIVRVADGFVEESSTERMKKFLMDYIDGLPDTFDGGVTPLDLKELVIKQYNTLFNEGFLEFLPTVQLDFLRDTRDQAFFAFKNGVVQIDKDKVSIGTYKGLNRVIWRNQVIDFPISIDQSFSPDSCEFYRYIEKISGDEIERISYCLTLIGYILHRYKDPARPYAVVLAEETESAKEGGGTGKSIFVKSLAHLVRAVKIDGKNFSIDKNFALQRVSLDTQLIAIEDCKRDLDFEKFNSLITEGSTVEKKNKDELFIEYKDSPKFMFTTNYTANIKGNHGKRRSKVFEFAPFFGPANTPRDFFGHMMFEDWDQDEWNRFYNLMFFCISIYLQNGILEVKTSDKLKRKQICSQFGEEFLDWWQEYSSNGCEEFKPTKELYNGFMIENDLDNKRFSMTRFKKAVVLSAELFEWSVETRRNRQANNVTEFRVVKQT